MRNRRRLASRSFAASSATTSFVSGQSAPNREKSWPFAAVCRPKSKPPLLSDYSGPPKREIVPDELPVVKQPRLRTDRDVGDRPLQPIEPILPTQ